MIISESESATDYADGRALIEEYAAALNIDLCFQNFEDELSNLNRLYGSPHGFLLLAREGGEACGCVAVRSMERDICEMKRLYVKPRKRGLSIGRSLVQMAINRARKMGYGKMVLDTLPSMAAARSLYHSLGFRGIDAYYKNPLPGVQYMGLSLNG